MDIFHQNRHKRSIEPKRIVELMPNKKDICFAGRKLKYPMPSEKVKAEKFRQVLNTFILMLSHLHGESSGHYEPISA